MDDLSALRTVMEQSGMNTGVLDQQMAGSPGMRQNVVPSQGLQGGGIPTPQAMGATPPAQPAGGAPAPQGMGLPVGDPEAQLIIKSLSKRLDRLGEQGR